MDLTTLKDYLGLGAATDHDSLLQSLADSAIAAISNELGYSVSSHSVIQQCVGTSQIAFTDLPATSLVVRYRNDLTDVAGTTDTTLTLWTDYYVYKRHIELITSRCSDPRIILTYNAGWSSLPDPIEAAAQEWVKYHFKGLDKLQAGEIADTRMPRDIASLLAPYKAVIFP